MNKTIFAFLLGSYFLSACSASPQAMQTAIPATSTPLLAPSETPDLLNLPVDQVAELIVEGG